jgi:hypothetical protein
MQLSDGEWFYDEGRRLRCRLLEHVDTWGQTAVRVWYPEAQTILLVAPEQLKPVEDLRTSAKTPCWHRSNRPSFRFPTRFWPC